MSEHALRKGLVRLAHEHPEHRAALLPLLKEAVSKTAQEKGSPEEALSKCFGEFADYLANGVKKELAGDFKKMTIDKAVPGLRSSALVEFELEDGRKDSSKWADKGEIWCSVELMPGDRSPKVSIMVHWNRKQLPVLEGHIPMGQGPKGFWQRLKARFVQDFYTVSAQTYSS